MKNALENDAYSEVDRLIKQRCVRILDRPDEMHYVSCNINEDIQQADLLYEYGRVKL